MVFGKIKSAVFRIFKRGHPDIYSAVKEYCEEHDISISDITAAALSAWMASSEESKEVLEQKMKQRRLESGSSSGGKFNMNQFKEICEGMGEMFKAMNEARAGMSMTSMLSDFKAVSNTITELKGSASEAGKGSVEDLLLTALLTKVLPGAAGVKKKTGTGKIKKVED